MIENVIDALRFPLPSKNQVKTAKAFDQKWGRWISSADQDADARNSTSLSRLIARTLAVEIRAAVLILFFHGIASFLAAFCLKELIVELLSDTPDGSKTYLILVGVITFTAIAWISLNHIFRASDLMGIGARSYVERRLLYSIASFKEDQDDSRSVVAVFDRECTRVELAWSGFVMIALAAVTIFVTIAYFWTILGISAVAIFAVIALFGYLIYRGTDRLGNLYGSVSKLSGRRVSAAGYIVQNRLPILVNKLGQDALSRHDGWRSQEELALRKTATLIAFINLASTVAPALSLLAAVVFHVWMFGFHNASGIVAAIALVGTLRSVANGIPDGIQNIIQGKVAHATITQFLNAPIQLPVTIAIGTNSEPRHIAIVGSEDSGRSMVLAAAAATEKRGCVLVPIEPWIFTGTFRENLRLYRDASNDEILDALRAVHLSPALGYGPAGEDRLLDGANWGVSRGQAKRIELARALISDADVICLDQPTTGLDPALAENLLSGLLSGPWREKTVIIVTDKPHEIALCDEQWQVEDGKIVATVAASTERKPLDSQLHNWEDVPNLEVGNTVTSETNVAELNPPLSATVLKRIANRGLLALFVMVLTALVARDAFSILSDWLLTQSGFADDFASDTVRVLAAIATVGLITIATSWLCVVYVLKRLTRVCNGYAASFLRKRDAAGSDFVKDRIGRITRDQRRLDEMLPDLTLEVCGAATLLIVTLIYSASTGYITLAAMPVLVIVYLYLSARGRPLLRASNAIEMDAAARYLQRVAEVGWSKERFSIRGMRSVPDWLDTISRTKARTAFENALTRRWFAYSIDLVAVTIFSVVAISSVVSFQLGLLGGAGVLSLSLVYGVMSLFGRSTRTLVQLDQLLDSYDRLALEPGHVVETKVQHNNIDNKLPVAGVVFDCVSYRYRGSTTLNVKDFSLSLCSGESVSIVGPSGSGKSTLVSLVVGDLLPTSGQVMVLGSNQPYIDRNSTGHDLLYYSAIPVFRPGPLWQHFVSDRQSYSTIIDALRFVEAEHLLTLIPGGLEFEVDVDGTLPLTQAQAQRFALAAAYISKPKVLLLDEATSELSTDAQIQILDKLLKSFEDSIIVIVSHDHRVAEMTTRSLAFNKIGGQIEILR